MIVSLEWLKEFIEVSLPTGALADLLTEAGLGVEDIRQSGGDFPKVVVGQIVGSDPHPDADRLSVCQVNDGTSEPRQIVCGAKNYQVGDKVPVALPGAVLPGNFKIKSGKLRGVRSDGMMCSGKELGLAADADGLLILQAEATVGGGLAELFPPKTSFELEITPNRADWLSHVGIAREISVFTGAKVALPEPSLPEVVENSDLLTVDPAGGCPYYTLRKIRDVKVGPSPAWLIERLEACGLRSVNNVVDVTNYVMLELGQPLHAFDATAIHGGKIQVRSAKEGEAFVALDGKTYELKTGDSVIADADHVLALGGVMGGLKSGVTEATTEVWLESARFDPAAIRRTARRLDLHSDSSYRFERGLDPALAELASARAVELILQVAGGEAEPFVTVQGHSLSQPVEIDLSHARASALLGLELTDERVVEILLRVGCRPVNQQADSGRWEVPTWRLDLLREVDLIEELARCVGINNIPARLMAMPAAQTEADRFYDFSWELRRTLVVEGFCEARTSTLVSPSSAASVPGALILRNPLGEEQSVLRPGLTSGLMTVASRNFHHGADDVRLFEIGRIYGGAGPEERFSLGLVVSSRRAPRHWKSKEDEGFEFFDLKGVLRRVIAGKLSFKTCQREGFALAAEILFQNTVVGFAGVLNPSAAAEVDAPFDLLVAELELAALLPGADAPKATQALPKFPSVRRDLAVVLPVETSYQALTDAVQALRLSHLQGVEVFDVFVDPEGKRLPADRKSVAIALSFQSLEKTLESAEVDQLIQQVVQGLSTALGATFRE